VPDELLKLVQQPQSGKKRDLHIPVLVLITDTFQLHSTALMHKLIAGPGYGRTFACSTVEKQNVLALDVQYQTDVHSHL
jgi:hypothetical protein